MKHWCILIIILATTDALKGPSWKAASFETSLDFERKNSTDSFKYDIVRLYDGYGNQTYRLHPLQKNYGTIHLTRTASIVYDGVDLFLNLKKLRVSKGFLRIHSPEAYSCIMGHPQKDKVNAVDVSTAILTGAVGAAISQGASEDMKRSVPYVFCLETGMIHPLTEATTLRFLEAYPEVSILYTKDPNRKKVQTMRFYLEILNDMIATE